jgi:hypothetical protein
MKLTDEAKAIISRDLPSSILSDKNNVRYNAIKWALTSPELLAAQGLVKLEDVKEAIEAGNEYWNLAGSTQQVQ